MALARALSRQWRTTVIDLVALPPDARLIDQAGPEWCLSQAVVPWRRTGGVTFVATARPEAFAAHRPRLGAAMAPVLDRCIRVSVGRPEELAHFATTLPIALAQARGDA